MPGVTAANINGGGLRLTVTGSLDATVKKLAEFEVVTMTSREPDLEDVFLHFYGEGERPCLRNAFFKGLRDRRRSFPVWAVGMLPAAALAVHLLPEHRQEPSRACSR